MEPLSTLALVAAFLAPIPVTKKLEWERPLSYTTQGQLTTPTAAVGSFEPVTAAPAFDATGGTYNKLEAIAGEVRLYSELPAEWDGDGSRTPSASSVNAATEFLMKSPGGLPLPKPMLSQNGEVGFFWDLERGYADISFDENGAASFFSRAHDGKEFFQESILVVDIDASWFFAHLADLDQSVLLAA